MSISCVFVLVTCRMDFKYYLKELNTGAFYPLYPGHTIFGRRSNCVHHQLQYRQNGRIHFVIYLRQDATMVISNYSRSPTLIDGRRLYATGGLSLRLFDIIRVPGYKFRVIPANTEDEDPREKETTDCDSLSEDEGNPFPPTVSSDDNNESVSSDSISISGLFEIK